MLKNSPHLFEVNFAFKTPHKMAYFKLGCRIVIDNKMVLKGLRNIEIKKSVFSMTDTATLDLSTYYYEKGRIADFKSVPSRRAKFSSLLKKGMPITVELGYNGKLRKEFEGFIANIEENNSLILSLEGLGYLLKQKRPLKKIFKKATLKEVVTYVLDGTGIELYENIPEVQLFNFMIDGTHNCQGVIQDLLDDYLLVAYFKEKVLYVVLTMQVKDRDIKYVMNRNIISRDNLKWKEVEDIKMTMNIEDRNTGAITTIEEGSSTGRVVHLKEVGDSLNIEFCKQLIKSQLSTQANIGGYTGFFETMLIPNADTTCEAHILNPDYPFRDGAYFISSVRTTFGTGGAKREIELGGKLVL